jgi:hypothetical protein
MIEADRQPYTLATMAGVLKASRLWGLLRIPFPSGVVPLQPMRAVGGHWPSLHPQLQLELEVELQV